MITASIATLKEREKSLLQTLYSLKDQVDKINLVLNNYEKLPPWIDRFPIGQAELADNSLGDAGKFKYPGEGYNLTCDDDIIYPSDYAKRCIHHIEKYHRKAVISFHGKRVPNHKIKSFYAYTQNFACKDAQKEDIRIHIPGTGVMAWHSDTIQFKIEKFKRKNMADVWVGIQCHELGVKVYCVSRPEGYFGFVKHDNNIWANEHKSDEYQTARINEVVWI